MEKIITIQGPTASGKSSLAMKIAESLGSEIISADSRQIYRYLNIGTAKPSIKEREKIKHHLIDIINPDEIYNAGDFCSDVERIVLNPKGKQAVPLIVGGTGFYIKALLNGLFNSPKIPFELQEKLRQQYEKFGNEFIYNELLEVDSETALRIHKNDSQRILRALEIFQATGKTIGEHWKEQAFVPKFSVYNIFVNCDRDFLYKKINRRVDSMMEKGLLREIESIIEMGYDFSLAGLNSVGYKEFLPFIENQENLQTCIEKVKQNSRHYAKRQLTWYRKIDFDLTIDSEKINFLDILKKVDDFICN